MRFVLHVLNYEAPILEGRFDALIAQALAKQDPRLHIEIVRVAGAIGQFGLRCGARFNGLIGDGYVVENLEHGTFKVVDYQDADSSLAVQLAASEHFRGALYTMFHGPRMWRLFKEKTLLIRPGFFLDQYPLLTAESRAGVRERRKRNLDDRLLFRGTILKHRDGGSYAWHGKPFRQAAVVLQEKYPNEVDISDDKLARPEWFLKAAEYRVVLALPGHPWCYREFELLNLGIPILTYPWHSHVQGPALPTAGIHYIATEDLRREEPGFAKDPEEGADKIMQAFRATRSYPNYTEGVGRAGQKWYDWALSPEAIAAGTLRFLNLDGPEWIAEQPAVGPLPRHTIMEA